MKVIGLSQGGYIIDASKNEVANLMGYSCKEEVDEYPKPIRMPLIGEEIDIEKLYGRLQLFETRSTNLLKIRDSINRLMKAYEDIDLLIPKTNNKGEDYNGREESN